MCRVSVCIATYNGEDYIERQLRSILIQLSAMDEIVISDNGSQDETLRIINSFKDSRIRLFLNRDEERSVVKNFENALNKARGEYIFLSDQDDIWESRKLAVIFNSLRPYDLVVSDCSIIGMCSDNNIICDSYFSLRNSGKGILKNILANTYMGSCMAFNRFILEKALPFPSNIPMHDWWIGLVGEIFGSIVFCPEKLIKYRRHCNNSSPFVGTNKYGLSEQIKFRKNIIIPLLKRWIKYYVVH